MNWYDGVGTLGVAMVLAAYFLLQKETLKSDGHLYLWLNLIGSALILLTVFYAWNLSAFIIECAWIAISIYGLCKHWRKKKV